MKKIEVKISVSNLLLVFLPFPFLLLCVVRVIQKRTKNNAHCSIATHHAFHRTYLFTQIQ